MPVHDPGHTPLSPDWGEVVRHFREVFGGWAALADALVRRGAGELPSDPSTVEKGLRRLARRGQRSGGQYGSWLLRHLGLPPSCARWARELGQYHSRFADLPTTARREQLLLWDRPPVAESRLSAWIDVGLASVHLRMREREDCVRRLEYALRRAPTTGPDAEAETALLAAYIDTDDGRRERANERFDQVEALLPSMSREERLCYRARLLGQRAYHLTKPAPGEREQPAAALELFEAIEAPPDLPFVCYRKAAGLAWCRWRLGETEAAITLARSAAEWAADGGLVRFRVMALIMLGRMTSGAQAVEAWERAQRLARLLEDEDLERRVRGARRHRERSKRG